jgi:hypothetical protein
MRPSSASSVFTSSARYLNSQPVSGGFFGGICLKIHTLPIDLDA